MESRTNGQLTVQDGEIDDASAALPSPRDDGSETEPLAESSNIIRGED
jgi:hypothetical protein